MQDDQFFVKAAVQEAFEEGLWEDMLIKTYYDKDGSFVLDTTGLDKVIMKSEDKEIYLMKYGPVIAGILTAISRAAPVVIRTKGGVTKLTPETARKVIAGSKAKGEGLWSVFTNPTKRKAAIESAKNLTPTQIKDATVKVTDTTLGTNMARGTANVASKSRKVKDAFSRLNPFSRRGPSGTSGTGQKGYFDGSKWVVGSKPAQIAPKNIPTRVKDALGNVALRPVSTAAKAPGIRNIPGAQKFATGTHTGAGTTRLAANLAGAGVLYGGMPGIDEGLVQRGAKSAISAAANRIRGRGSPDSSEEKDAFTRIRESQSGKLKGKGGRPYEKNPFLVQPPSKQDDPLHHKKNQEAFSRQVRNKQIHFVPSPSDIDSPGAKLRHWESFVPQARRDIAEGKGFAPQIASPDNPESPFVEVAGPKPGAKPIGRGRLITGQKSPAPYVPSETKAAKRDPKKQRFMGRREGKTAHYDQMQDDYKATALKLFKTEIKSIVKEAVLNNTMPELATSMPSTISDMPVTVFNDSVRSLQDQELPPVQTKEKEDKEEALKVTEAVVKKLMKAPPAATKQDVRAGIREGIQSASRMNRQPTPQAQPGVTHEMPQASGQEVQGVGQGVVGDFIWGWGGQLMDRMGRDSTMADMKFAEHPELRNANNEPLMMPINSDGSFWTEDQVKDFYDQQLEENPEYRPNPNWTPPNPKKGPRINPQIQEHIEGG